MVDHRELFEAVCALLERAGLPLAGGPGQAGLYVGHRPQGVAVGFRPHPHATPAPALGGGHGLAPVAAVAHSLGTGPAVVFALSALLEQAGFTTTTDPAGNLLVTGTPADRPPPPGPSTAPAPTAPRSQSTHREPATPSRARAQAPGLAQEVPRPPSPPAGTASASCPPPTWPQFATPTKTRKEDNHQLSVPWNPSAAAATRDELTSITGDKGGEPTRWRATREL